MVGGGTFIFLNSKSEHAYAAINYTWTGAGGNDWNTSASWSPAGIPQSGDNVTIGAVAVQPELSTDVTVNNIITNAGSQLNLKNYYLTVNGNATFNGGNISNSNLSGSLLVQGGTTTFGNSSGGPTLDVPVTVNSSNFTLRSTTFNHTLSLKKNGSGNDNSYGNNTFNGITTITNNSSAQVLFSNNVKDVFNGDLSISNTGTSVIYLAYNDASATQFNGNVFLNSTSGSGIQFGSNTGIATLAAAKTISIGAGGFSSGSLLLRHFIYPGTSDLSFNLTGNSSITYGPASSFGGGVSSTSATLLFNGCTFGGVTSFIKTGSSNDQSAGNNLFSGVSTITNSGSGYVLLGNSGPDIFSSAATFNNLGSADFYIAHNSAGNQFNGNTTINNSTSSGTHGFYIAESNANASAVFNGDVTVINAATVANSMVRFNLRGTTTFNGNIAVNSTSGSNASYGIFFGWTGYTGTATLAASKTIAVGSIGFSNGALGFCHFSQNGTVPVNLNLSGSSILLVNPFTTFGGDFTSTSGSLFLNGGTFSGTSSFIKTGSSNDNSSGGNSFADSCSITNNGSGYVLMGNVSPDVFNAVATFTNSGTSDFYIASASAANQYNGNVIINNTGSGSANRFYICESAAVASAVFNGDVIVNNTGNANSSYVRFNLRGTNTFNGNIELNSTAGTSGTYGVYFGWPGYAGASAMASGKNITIGSDGFTTGELELINFTESGNAAINLPLSPSTSLTLGPATSIGGNFNATCGSLYLNGCAFGGTMTATKSGSSNNTSAGGNIFSGNTIITSNGSGNITMGNSNPDIFNGDAIFNNSGTSYFYLANASAGNQFNGNVTLNNTGTGTDNRLMICESAASATAIFNGNVIANNTGSANTSFIRFNLRGVSTFNGNIILNSTAGTGTNTAGIYFGWPSYNGSASMAAEKNISIGNSGFSRGELSLIKFTQAGSSPTTLNLPPTVTLTIGPASALGGDVSATSGSVYLNGCTFGGTTNFNKTGTANNNSTGGNIFSGNAIITNSSTANLELGNSSADIFNSNATFNNTGSAYFYIADNSAGNQFNGITTFNNTGTGTDLRMMICEGTSTSATFNGDVIINNTGTATDGFTRFNLRGTCNFNGNISVNSSLGTASYYGIDFGWPGYSGTSILANGKTITTGNLGFTKGNLFLQGLVQSGSSSQNITLGGNSVLVFGNNSVINGNLTASTPAVQFNGATFSGVTTIYKTGNTNDISSGNNTFNGTFNLVNNSTGNITLSNSNKDTYNSSVTYTNTSSGIIYPAYNDASGTLFNGNVFVNNTGTGSIRFGQNSGNAILASGNTIGIGNTGFTSGDLYIRKFTQQGNTAQSINLIAGTAALYLQAGTAFNGPVSFSFPQIYLNGSTFNGTAVLEKNGATNNTSSGANIFNSTTTISNQGTGNFILANSTADDFNGNSTFSQTGTGLLQPAYNTNCTFSKDISTTGSLSAITFGSSGGRVIIDGTDTQNLTGNASLIPVITRLTMATGTNGNLTLNIPLTITTSLVLNSGKIITGTNELKVNSTASASVTGFSASSYINGNLRRNISSSGTYDFPVGSDANFELATVVLSGAAGFTNLLGKFNTSLPVLNSLPLIGVLLGLNPVTNMLNSGYWTLTPNNPMTGGTYSITLNSKGQTNGNTNPATYCVLKRPNALLPWVSTGIHSNATQAINNGVVTAVRSGLTSFSDFGEGYYGGGSLPIKLIYFNADLTENLVSLTWATASELNNNFFTIERSADGQLFKPLLTKPGAGNSTEELFYAAEDLEPLKGFSYYRLKQTDYDGHYSYSDIVTVKNGEGGGVSQLELKSVAPNPFSESFKVNFMIKAETDVQFLLMSSTGAIVKDEKIKTQEGYNTYEFRDDANLQKGIYFLTLIYEDQKIIQKIIKE